VTDENNSVVAATAGEPPAANTAGAAKHAAAPTNATNLKRRTEDPSAPIGNPQTLHRDSQQPPDPPHVHANTPTVHPRRTPAPAR
jgi:hypothetical protein